MTNLYTEKEREELIHLRKELFVHADTISVDFGHSAIRTLFLLNTGALVAILAFLGNIWGQSSKGNQDLLSNMITSCEFFFFGSIAVMISYLFAYLQSGKIANYQYGLYLYCLRNEDISKKDLKSFSKPFQRIRLLGKHKDKEIETECIIKFYTAISTLASIFSFILYCIGIFYLIEGFLKVNIA